MASKDKEVAVVEKKIHPIIQRAETFAIVDEKTMKEASVMLSEINRFGDHIETEKNKVLKPLNAAIKAERARWKPMETIIEAAVKKLRDTMSKFQTEKTRLAREEEERIANRVGKGKGKLKAETAMQQIEEIERPADVVSTDAGTVKFRTVKNFEITDFAKLPDEFKLANEPAIRAAMKESKELPGVRYFETQEPVNFR